MIEPDQKRAIAFFDGQNPFHQARAVFGHGHPNYDPIKLHDELCRRNRWNNVAVRFYSGTPTQAQNPACSKYWHNRRRALERKGVTVIYRNLRLVGPPGRRVLTEKGIDVRIALDVISMARNNDFDVGVIFSQDQDFAEVAQDIREVARATNRWIKLVSAFPVSHAGNSKRGINGTDWCKIDEATYNACLDQPNYR